MIRLTAIKLWIRPGWFIANLIFFFDSDDFDYIDDDDGGSSDNDDKVDCNQTVDMTWMVDCKPDFYMMIMMMITVGLCISSFTLNVIFKVFFSFLKTFFSSIEKSLTLSECLLQRHRQDQQS